MSDIYQQIGARIRELREAAGLSQAKLSDLSGVSTEFLSRIERGLKGASVLTLARIAEALGVEIKGLLDFDDKRPSPRRVRALRAAKLIENAGDDLAGRVADAVEALLGPRKRK
jgi:transcriptional regulator with XRE-family HTH domain